MHLFFLDLHQSQPLDIEGLREQINHLEEKIKSNQDTNTKIRGFAVKGVFSEAEYFDEKIKLIERLSSSMPTSA